MIIEESSWRENDFSWWQPYVHHHVHLKVSFLLSLCLIYRTDFLEGFLVNGEHALEVDVVESREGADKEKRGKREVNEENIEIEEKIAIESVWKRFEERGKAWVACVLRVTGHQAGHIHSRNTVRHIDMYCFSCNVVRWQTFQISMHCLVHEMDVSIHSNIHFMNKTMHEITKSCKQGPQKMLI